MGTGDLCRVPPAAARHGRARQSAGTGPSGDCRKLLWIPGPRGQYSGKIRFIEKPWVQVEGDRHVAKRSSDTRVAYPEVKVQVRGLMRVVGIVAPFAPRMVGTRRNFFYRVLGGKWEQEISAGCPQQQYITGVPGKVQGRNRKGIVERSCGYRARGSVVGESSFYRETWGMEAPYCHWRSNIGT